MWPCNTINLMTNHHGRQDPAQVDMVYIFINTVNEYEIYSALGIAIEAGRPSTASLLIDPLPHCQVQSTCRAKHGWRTWKMR